MSDAFKPSSDDFFRYPTVDEKMAMDEEAAEKQWDLFESERILALKDPHRGFPSTTASCGVALLSWNRTIPFGDATIVPLLVKIDPTISDYNGRKRTRVATTYEAGPKFELDDVRIELDYHDYVDDPKGAIGMKEMSDGRWWYVQKMSRSDLYTRHVGDNNRKETLWFAPIFRDGVDIDAIFPIEVNFRCLYSPSFADIKVVKVLPLDGGIPPEFCHGVPCLSLVGKYTVSGYATL